MSVNNHAKLQNKIQKLVILAVLAAIVAILQYFGGAIAIPGTGLSITLTLVPIVLGAILYGPVFGGVLGTVFGGMVALSVLQGTAGILAAQMFASRPVLTIFLCIFKGLACGAVAGLAGSLLMKKNLYLGVVLSAILCPIINTAIFSLGLVVFYSEIAIGFAEGASLLAFVIFGIVGVNFVIEFAVNLICAPVIVRVIRALKKSGVLKLDTGNV
ncbi:MAG: ECF transporter S component [Clostridia bacterium]|nr:ECF transporter S component [Clostridia bacterium]